MTSAGRGARSVPAGAGPRSPRVEPPRSPSVRCPGSRGPRPRQPAGRQRPEAAGLEILLGGVRLRAQRPTRIAVTGAQVGVTVAGRPVAWGAAVSVRADELVEISAARDGIRSWLAVAGGIDVPAVLGSRSTDTLTGLGPDPIGAGARLATGVAARPPTEAEETDAVAANAVPRARPEVLELPLRLGPREDWFTDAAVELLLRQEYAVDPDSNRTALRLAAEGRLERRRPEELPSEGIVTGAVQVPASGSRSCSSPTTRSPAATRSSGSSSPGVAGVVRAGTSGRSVGSVSLTRSSSSSSVVDDAACESPGRRQPTSAPGPARSRPSRTARSPARALSPTPSPGRTRRARRPCPGIQPAP